MRQTLAFVDNTRSISFLNMEFLYYRNGAAVSFFLPAKWDLMVTDLYEDAGLDLSVL